MGDSSPMVACLEANCNCSKAEGSAPTGGFHFVATATVSCTAGPSTAVSPTAEPSTEGYAEVEAYSAPLPPAAAAYSAQLPPAAEACSAQLPPAAARHVVGPSAGWAGDSAVAAWAGPWAGHSLAGGPWAGHSLAGDAWAGHSLAADAWAGHSPDVVAHPRISAVGGAKNGATGDASSAEVGHGATAVCFGPAAGEAAQAVKATPSHPLLIHPTTRPPTSPSELPPDPPSNP
jgi:hypothetical protein